MVVLLLMLVSLLIPSLVCLLSLVNVNLVAHLNLVNAKVRDSSFVAVCLYIKMTKSSKNKYILREYIYMYVCIRYSYLEYMVMGLPKKLQ